MYCSLPFSFADGLPRLVVSGRRTQGRWMPLVWLVSTPALTKQLAERKSLVISPATSWVPLSRCWPVVAQAAVDTWRLGVTNVLQCLHFSCRHQILVSCYLPVLPSLQKLKCISVVSSFRIINLNFVQSIFIMYDCRLVYVYYVLTKIVWGDLRKFILNKETLRSTSFHILVYDWHRDVLG